MGQHADNLYRFVLRAYDIDRASDIIQMPLKGCGGTRIALTDQSQELSVQYQHHLLIDELNKGKRTVPLETRGFSVITHLIPTPT